MATGSTTKKPHAAPPKKNPNTRGNQGTTPKGQTPNNPATAERPWTILDTVRGFSQGLSKYFASHEDQDMDNTTVGQVYIYTQALKKQELARIANATKAKTPTAARPAAKTAQKQKAMVAGQSQAA
jgi:hypothetical protein